MVNLRPAWASQPMRDRLKQRKCCNKLSTLLITDTFRSKTVTMLKKRFWSRGCSLEVDTYVNMCEVLGLPHTILDFRILDKDA